MTFQRDNEGGRGTRADSTVRALVNATGAPYAIAEATLAAGGRKRGCRFNMRAYLRAHPVALGYRFERVTFRRSRVASFIEDHPQGVFVLRVTRHVFALRDGVVIDRTAPRPAKIVTNAWKVSPVNAAATAQPSNNKE